MVLERAPDRAMTRVVWWALASARSFPWAAASVLMMVLRKGRATASTTASGARASAPERVPERAWMKACSWALLLVAATVVKTALRKALSTVRRPVLH